MAVIENPYVSHDLLIDKKLHEIIAPHVSHGKRPFRRWIDAWWLGLCIGHHQVQRLPLPERSQCTKFNDGGILSSDPWRITHLELLVLAEEGEDALVKPARVIRLASEYANSGLKWIADELLGEANGTLRLMNKLGEFRN